MRDGAIRPRARPSHVDFVLAYGVDGVDVHLADHDKRVIFTVNDKRVIFTVNDKRVIFTVNAEAGRRRGPGSQAVLPPLSPTSGRRRVG
jgi:hypothetical protein